MLAIGSLGCKAAGVPCRAARWALCHRVPGDGSYRSPQHLQGLLWSSATKAAGSSAEADPGIHGLSCHVAHTGSPCPASLSLSASRCLSWSVEGVELCAAPQKAEEAGCSPYSPFPVMGTSMLVLEQDLLGGWEYVAQRNSTFSPYGAIFHKFIAPLCCLSFLGGLLSISRTVFIHG